MIEIVTWDSVEQKKEIVTRLEDSILVQAILGRSPGLEEPLPGWIDEKTERIFEIAKEGYAGMKTASYKVSSQHNRKPTLRYFANFSLFDGEGRVIGGLDVIPGYVHYTSGNDEGYVPGTVNCTVRLPLFNESLEQKTKSVLQGVWPFIEQIHYSTHELAEGVGIYRVFFEEDKPEIMLAGKNVLEDLKLPLDHKSVYIPV